MISVTGAKSVSGSKGCFAYRCGFVEKLDTTSRDEYAAYCDVLKEAARGVIHIAVTNRFAALADDEYELLNDASKPNGCREVLEKAAPLLKRGSAPQMLLRPMLREFTLQKPYPFMEIQAAGKVFNQSVETQKQIYADPAFRAAVRGELAEGRRLSGQPPKTIVCKVGNPKLRAGETRTVGEIATERNADQAENIVRKARAISRRRGAARRLSSRIFRFRNVCKPGTALRNCRRAPPLRQSGAP